MIRGIFAWLMKATKAKKVEAYDISVTSVDEDGSYVMPEALPQDSDCAYGMAVNYAVTCQANCMTQLFKMGHMEFLLHNIDQRRFILAHHQDGAILIFEVEDTSSSTYIEVDQMHQGTYFKLTNAKLIASTLGDEVRAEDEKTYAFYTIELDPATLEIAA